MFSTVLLGRRYVGYNINCYVYVYAATHMHVSICMHICVNHSLPPSLPLPLPPSLPPSVLPYSNGRLFWADSTQLRIMSSSLDGSNVQSVVSSGFRTLGLCMYIDDTILHGATLPYININDSNTDLHFIETANISSVLLVITTLWLDPPFNLHALMLVEIFASGYLSTLAAWGVGTEQHY